MIGIIPKPLKKIPRLYEFAPYIAFGLVVIVVLVYIGLLFFANKASKQIDALDESIAQVGNSEERMLESKILFQKQLISDFSKLLVKHNITSNFFKFLEENAHPKVWFTKLELSAQDSQAVLSGETPDFETLGQQIQLFQKQDLVNKIIISDLSFAKTGASAFTFTILLDPAIFKNNE